MNEFNTAREFEEKHVAETVKIVENNCAAFRDEVAKMRADIEQMQEHFHEGDVELWVTLNNTITMHDNTLRALARNERARNKPYFGRIIFTDRERNTKESLYIGRGGINRNITEQVVVDWRAPISNVYYENGMGECSYLSPEGSDVLLDLELKRTFDIEEGTLNDYVDSAAVTNDELLTKYLTRNKEAVLGEIVATIQKEQNDIIRKTPFRNVIVQGVAGSGKTTVAMHRISYILYNYPDRITPDDFYIIGSNRMLLNYITGVLPELDVEGIRQMTMEELFVRLIYEEWAREIKASVISVREDDSEAGTTARFEALKEFCDGLEARYFDLQDVMLNRSCFVEGVENGVTGVYDRSDRQTGEDTTVKILSADYVVRFLKDNPTIPLLIKAELLNEKLKDNLEFELQRHSSLYTVKEKNAIRKAFADKFAAKKYGSTVFEIYDEFLLNVVHRKPTREYDVNDLASIAYIYKRIAEKEVISEAHHIVIDEAQDYGMLAYRVLDYCVKDCTYTIMGDTSQNIRSGQGLNSWEELRGLLLTRSGDSFCTLRKSYRNTIEISGFATKILDHGSFELYPVEPIIRHGAEPEIMHVSENEAVAQTAALCRSWQNEGYGTIAVICRREDEAAELNRQLLTSGFKVLENDPDKAEFGSGVIVLPIALTKGLEFDAVCVYEPNRDNYPVDDHHAKLLYVASTRALHRLGLICADKDCKEKGRELTGLITDEIPKNKARKIIIADPVIDDNAPTASELAREEKRRKEADNEYVKAKTLAGATARTLSNPDIQKAVEAAGNGNGGDVKEDKKKTTEHSSTPEEDIRGTFAAEVNEDEVTPPGHAAPSLAPRWINKQPGGIYVQSRYGILRIIPTSPDIIRLSFCKGSDFRNEGDKCLKQFAMMKKFLYRDTPKLLEIGAGNIGIALDKQTGAITYKDGKGKQLFTEKVLEQRFISDTAGYTFLNFRKDTSFYAYDHSRNQLKYLPAKAVCITQNDDAMPLLTVKDSFAIMPVNESRTVFSNLPGRQTTLLTEGSGIDYYVIVGADTDAILENYRRLNVRP